MPESVAPGAQKSWRPAPILSASIVLQAAAVTAVAIRPHAWPGRLHLGYGREDRFAASHRLMAAALSTESVDTVPGGHEWPAWRHLWGNFLDAVAHHV